MSGVDKRIDIDYPDSVTDRDSYDRFLRIKKELDEDPKRYHQTSDPEIIIDLCTSVYIVDKMIYHLPQAEKNEIKAKLEPYRSKLGVQASHKRKAFAPSKNADPNDKGVLNIPKSVLFEYFGRMFSVAETYKALTTEHKYVVSKESLRLFYEKNIKEITEKQEEYKQKYSDIRLGYKRSRLDELCWIYNKTKDNYIRTGVREDAKLMQSLLEQIKKEVEGDLVINGKLKIEVEQNINIQVQQQYSRELNVSHLIILRMAAKLNVKPDFIMSRMANSMYAKFTGFKNPDISREEDEIIYPSDVIYNLDNIVETNRKMNEIDAENKALPEVDTEKVVNFRDQLIARLNIKQAYFDEEAQIIKDNTDKKESE